MTDLNSLTCSVEDFAELSLEFLRLEKTVRFQARGYSMHPLVRDNDILLVEPVGARRIRIGDVVLCKVQTERIVVHRVVKRRVHQAYCEFLIQGDQVTRADGWLRLEQVFGKVAAIERGRQRIDMHHPVVKWLGLLAALRSTTNCGRGRTFHSIRGFIKRLPVLSDYLQ